MYQLKQAPILFLTLLLATLLLTLPYPLQAHSTKNSIHHVKQCSRFHAPWKRKSCRRCLRQRGHHYHPYRSSHRCMVNHHYRNRKHHDRHEHDHGRRPGRYNDRQHEHNRRDRQYERQH